MLTFSSPRLPAPLPPSVSEALSSVFYDRFIASSPGQGGASAGDRPAGLPLSEAGPVCPLLTEALALGAVRAGARGTRCAVAPEPTEAVGMGRLSPPERCHRGGRLTLGSPGPDPGFRRVLRAEGHGWACALRAWAPGAGGNGTAPSAPERPRRRVLAVSCPRLRGQPGAHVPLRASIRVARGFGPVPPTSHSAPRRTGRGVLSARGGFAGPPEAAAQFPPPSLPVTVRKGQREAPSAKGSCAPRLLCHVAPLTCTASGSRRGPLARQVSASNVGRRCSRRACRGRDRWIERPPHVVEKVKSDVTPAGA